MENNILRTIESVIEKLKHFREYDEVRLDNQEIELIKEIYNEILPNRSTLFITSCGSCIKDAMRVILSYYEREIKKEVLTQFKVELVAVDNVEIKKNVIKRKPSKVKPNQPEIE